jgi:23S rRNA pseudouridine1911/1915/1917 synthase
LIVVNKPPGLVVHPAPGHSQGTLVHGLLHHCQGGLAGVGGKLRPGIVHRLDKDTSGALVAAKSDLAHRGLVASFAAGKVDKTYLALVWGAPPKKGKAETGIGRHPVDRKRMSSKGRHTKPAQSRWQVTRRFKPGFSLLRVKIHTGRTHQIRVHLSEAGYPVAADATYGGKRKQRSAPEPVAAALKKADRQMLHALALGFDHPITGQRLDLVAPLPSDFRTVLRALEEADRA